MLLCLGWALVVQPDLFRAFQVVQERLPLPSRQLVPYEPIQFGFLGAYWFILQDLIRRYFRDDLKTGAYISAAARIVLVTVTVTTVSLIPLGSIQQQKVLAFLIGVFPQLGIQVLKAAVTKPFGRLIPTIKTEHPLSDLGGLTIWDEARLLEEGIEDIQTSSTPTSSTCCCAAGCQSTGWSTGSTRPACTCVCPKRKSVDGVASAASSASRARHPDRD